MKYRSFQEYLSAVKRGEIEADSKLAQRLQNEGIKKGKGYFE